jgi:predicted transcriptional regulator
MMAGMYYTIIPAYVRYDKGIGSDVKLLYRELAALANGKGFTEISNECLSRLFGARKSSIAKSIKILADKGYIKAEYDPLRIKINGDYYEKTYF